MFPVRYELNFYILCRRNSVLKYDEEYYVSGHYASSCLNLKTPSCLYYKTQLSETGSCLRLQVKPAQLGPIDRASFYFRTSETLCFVI
jgi:hypothetical protein